MLTLRQSWATFARGTSFKVFFLALVYLDLLLTLFAVNNGFTEVNPLMVRLMSRPPELIAVRGVTPILVAWLVPAPLLAPAIGFLLAVSGWNLLQLMGFL